MRNSLRAAWYRIFDINKTHLLSANSSEDTE